VQPLLFYNLIYFWQVLFASDKHSVVCTFELDYNRGRLYSIIWIIIIICPWVLRSPRSYVDIIYFVVKLSGGSVTEENYVPMKVTKLKRYVAIERR